GLVAVRCGLDAGSDRHAAGNQTALGSTRAVHRYLRADGLDRSDRGKAVDRCPWYGRFSLADSRWRPVYGRDHLLRLRSPLSSLARHLASVRDGRQLAALRGGAALCGLKMYLTQGP